MSLQHAGAQSLSPAAEVCLHVSRGGPSALPQALLPSRVDILFFSLDGGTQGLLDRVTEVERARAMAMQFAGDRVAQLRTRAAVRTILGQRLRCSPREVLIEKTDEGKPFVRHAGLEFNVSHSANMGVIAVGARSQIGVDVEKMRFIEDWRQVSQRFFSPQETRELRAHGDEGGPAAFLRCFVRKEAYAKSLGRGIGMGFDTFTVPTQAWEPGRGTRIGIADAERLVVQLPVPKGFHGAIAVGSAVSEVHVAYWHLD